MRSEAGRESLAHIHDIRSGGVGDAVSSRQIDSYHETNRTLAEFLRILRKAKDLRAARSFAPRRMKLEMLTVDDIVRRALEEDLPDITSEAIFARGERGRA